MRVAVLAAALAAVRAFCTNSLARYRVRAAIGRGLDRSVGGCVMVRMLAYLHAALGGGFACVLGRVAMTEIVALLAFGRRRFVAVLCEHVAGRSRACVSRGPRRRGRACKEDEEGRGGKEGEAHDRHPIRSFSAARAANRRMCRERALLVPHSALVGECAFAEPGRGQTT